MKLVEVDTTWSPETMRLVVEVDLGDTQDVAAAALMIGRAIGDDEGRQVSEAAIVAMLRGVQL